ncbi:MAG: TIGR04283 family arsenosugar biosynthesis glycosyltransferase [Planctomycetales bacterium]
MNVSVIIPVLNEAALLESAIRRAWSAGADEVLVCDGGSDDETVQIADQQACRLLHCQRGRGVQQNQGARVSDGEVLLFLHVDTWLEPGAIEQIRFVLACNSRHGGGFRQSIDAEGLRYRWLESGNAARIQHLGLAYGDQGIFVRRSTFEQLGGFAEIALMEDLRFMRSLRRLSRPTLLPGPLHVSARRWQTQGVVRQTLRNWSLLAAEKLRVSPDRLARHYPQSQGKGEEF